MDLFVPQSDGGIDGGRVAPRRAQATGAAFYLDLRSRAVVFSRAILVALRDQRCHNGLFAGSRGGDFRSARPPAGPHSESSDNGICNTPPASSVSIRGLAAVLL